ncbi:MAG: CAP domain-containing protein [Cyanobacteria bacterium P01_A01_bin.17]
MTTQQRSSRQALVTNQAADKPRSSLLHTLLILSSLLVSCVGMVTEAQALPVRQAYQQSQIPNLLPQSAEMMQVEIEILHRINQQRQHHGLSPLQINAQLTQAARTYSKQMADYNFYSHTGVRGDTPRQRVEARGVSAQLVGENLFQFPQRGNPVTVTVQGWMGSVGHRRNILMSQMAETGIGIWKQNGTYYVTQLLVQPKATTATARPLN